MTGRKFSVRHSAGWHDFRYILGKSGWIFLIGLAVFLLLIPFSTAGLPGSSIFNLEVTHDQLKFRLFHPQVIPALLSAAVGMGLLAGLAQFRFVLDKKETTIFFSLGVTRSRLFLNRACVGALLLAGSIALPMGLSCWLNLRALGGYEGLVRNTVYLTLGLFLVSVVSFFVVAVASFAAGTLTQACVYWAGLMAAPTALCYAVNQLLNVLYWGSPWGAVTYSGTEALCPSLVSLSAVWNPLLFFLNCLETNGQFMRPLETAVPEEVNWMLLLGWCGAALCLGALALLLLRRRRAEMAGVADSNSVLAECIVLLTAFLVFAEIFSMLYSFGTMLAAVLGALGFTAVHLFWRRTLFAYGARRTRCGLSLVAQGAATALVCLICSIGFAGSTAHFLDTAEITQIQISYVGAPAFLNAETIGSSTGRGYYLVSTLVLDSQEAIEQGKNLQRLFLESGRMDTGSGDTVEDTVIPYDICFTYIDAAGREHTWYYDRASYAQLEAMLSLEGTAEVAEQQSQLFSVDGDSTALSARAYASADIYLTDSLLESTYCLTLETQQRQQLLSALSQDVASMSLEERYFPTSSVQAVLLFTSSGEQDCKYYTYHLDNAYVYLTQSYSHTLDWLEENGLLSLVQTTPEVEYVILQKFDPYIGINGLSYPMGMYFMAYCADTEDEFLIQKDFGIKYTISDPEEIQQLLAGLQDGCYMTRGGYLAAVKLAGETRLRYLFLPSWATPSFVQG